MTDKQKAVIKECKMRYKLVQSHIDWLYKYNKEAGIDLTKSSKGIIGSCPKKFEAHKKTLDFHKRVLEVLDENN